MCVFVCVCVDEPQYVYCVWEGVNVLLLLCCVASHFSFPGEMRVQLLNQTLLDLGFYDDGPYEVADQKQLNAQLIPVPYHSYLGRICPPCSLLLVHRREREGRRRATPGLRLDPDITTGSSNYQTVWGRDTSHSYHWDYFWLILSVCDSQKPLNIAPHPFFSRVNVCGHCQKCPQLFPAWAEFIWCQYFLKLGSHPITDEQGRWRYPHSIHRPLLKMKTCQKFKWVVVK